MPIQTIPQQVIPLEAPEVRADFRALVSNLVFFDDMPEAYKAYRYLQWLLKQSPSAPLPTDAVAEYEQMLRLLQFVALPALSEGEVEDFFKIHATVGLLHPDLDLWEKLVAKLVRIFVFELRDPFKAGLRAALEDNQEVLTEAMLHEAARTLPGTIANWLKDYRREAGGGKVSTLVRTAYLTNSINTKNLSAADREKVKKLIELYEKLKVSSMEDTGIEENYTFEDSQGRLRVLRAGVLEEVKDKNVDALFQKFRQSGLLSDTDLPLVERFERARTGQKETMATVRRMMAQPFDAATAKELAQLKQTRPSSTDLIELCYNAAFPGPGKAVNAPGAIAGLALMAERGELTKLLKPGSKFMAVFESWLRSKGKDSMLADVKLRPEAPEYLGQLLRMILEEKLKLNPAEAAKIGAHLGGLMRAAGKPEYFELAYFDVERKTFVWK